MYRVDIVGSVFVLFSFLCFVLWRTFLSLLFINPVYNSGDLQVERRQLLVSNSWLKEKLDDDLPKPISDASFLKMLESIKFKSWCYQVNNSIQLICPLWDSWIIFLKYFRLLDSFSVFFKNFRSLIQVSLGFNVREQLNKAGISLSTLHFQGGSYNIVFI